MSGRRWKDSRLSDRPEILMDDPSDFERVNAIRNLKGLAVVLVLLALLCGFGGWAIWSLARETAPAPTPLPPAPVVIIDKGGK